MRIAHITAAFPPYRSGTGTVCFNNAVGLAHLGHEVQVYTSENDLAANESDPPEIQVHRLPALFRIGNAPLLPDLTRLPAFDIVHIHYPFVFGAELIYLLSWFRHLPYVVTYHQDLVFEGALQVGVKLHHAVVGTPILHRARRLFLTSMDYGCSARIAPLVKRMDSRVRVVPNGVDDQRFRPGQDVSKLREQHCVSPEQPVVLFVGGLDRAHYFKGVSVLLNSLSHLTDLPIQLLIVGDGDLRPSYEWEAHQLGIAERVTFCGRVSEEDLPLYYALADVCVLPSITMGEAFGIVLLEAMATGKPVIASNLPGVRSVVHNGHDGFLTTVNDPHELALRIRLLIMDEDLRQQMGQAGRRKVQQQYTWSVLTRHLDGLYQQVLAEVGEHP